MKPRITDMITIAARLTHIPESEILGPRRFPAYCAIRAAIYMVAREWGYSWHEIGRKVGGRNHSSVFHGVRGAGKFAKVMDDFDGFLETLGRYADELPPFVRETRWQPPEFFSVLLSEETTRLIRRCERQEDRANWRGFTRADMRAPRMWTLRREMAA